jgi:outer membrane protein OmpA-like peptidoglycan-associated protein
VEEQDISREELLDRRRERREFTRDDLGDIIRKRVQRREKDGSIIIEGPGNRRIIRQRGRVIIENDDAERLRGRAKNVDVKKGPRGRSRTTISRRNGTQIITVKNRDGEVVRRIKRLRNGREIVLFNNEIKRGKRNHDRDRSGARLFIDLPDLRRDRYSREYYIYADRADEDEIEDILSGPPIEEFEEDYTLDEIRYSPDIRARLRKLNLNTITFASGSWEIGDDQIRKLEVVARVINRIIDRDPEQMFLFSGHTDAIGSEEDNLTLSDYRVETVARIMTDEFGVPPENIVTQGYGESDLLVDTDEAEAANRRVEFMRITPALAQYDGE